MENKAGKSVREMAKKRHRITNIILIGSLVVIIVLVLIIDNGKVLGLGGGVILGLFILISILPDLLSGLIKNREKLERRSNRGASAEEIVGDLVDNLIGDFIVIHDISCPYGNIDHVVIGKNSGVFLLETKAHGGKVRILSDGLLINDKVPEKDFIAQTLRNTYWLQDEIKKVVGKKIWITPIIVFTNAFVPFGKPIKGVNILNKRYLSDFLHNKILSETDLSLLWNSRNEIFHSIKNQKFGERN